MREAHREKNDQRARALASHDRNYMLRLLKTVDTWFPAYRVKHPKADKAEVVAKLATFVEEHRRRGFTKQEPRPLPESALLFEPLSRAHLKGIDTSIFGTTSGVAKAVDFKVYDVETPTKSDTEDPHDFRPLGGGSSFAGTHAALFWLGFARLDSIWDQISGSPSDRSVHMAVLRIDLPRPTNRVVARLGTSMFIDLGQGVEIINDWGLFDDEDEASLKIDFCGAFTRDGLGFPDPSAFGFTPAFSFGSTNHHFFGQDANMSRTEVLTPADKPSLYLGMRWTFAGADTRMQTGPTQHELNAFFGLQRTDNFTPGVLFSYETELVVSE